jgi:biotin carboxylase
MKPRILILGAGIHQVSAIRKAVAMGWRVVTADYLPGNLGHRYSHEYVNVSTADVDGVVREALRLRVDGVCTFGSDAALASVGAVCDRLGLRGISRRAAQIMSRKDLFRAFMRSGGRRAPRFVSGTKDSEVVESMAGLSFPVVVKPVDSSGSRGVARLDAMDPGKALAAVRGAMGYSHSRTVCAEEFLEGVEVGGDGLLAGGRFAFVAVTQKHLDGFLVKGHRLPGALSPADAGAVVEALEDCCGALGYREGPLNFDVMVHGGRATIIEISGRLGGNGIPAVIERATGEDLEEAVLRGALGERTAFRSRGEALRGCASVVFGSPVGGTIERIESFEGVRRLVPEVLELRLAASEGERAEAFAHNGAMIGYAVFDCARAEDYASLSGRIVDSIGLRVREDPVGR